MTKFALEGKMTKFALQLTCAVGAVMAYAGAAEAAPANPEASRATPNDAANAREPSSSSDTELGEIIVTATKRAENVQSIPMSINAFSGERLEESGAVDVRDVQFLSAGVHVTTASGVAKITIRGVSEAFSARTSESGVAMNRDGVYLADRRERRIAFFDVERVEVLRGPQGTLYGRNATGGAVNIITKGPTDEPQGGISATLGNYNLIETEGFFSGPIIEDKLSGRLAFQTRDNTGYTPNVFNGERHDKFDVAALRGKLRYEPTDNFRLDLAADFATDNSSFIAVQSKRDPNVPLNGQLLGGAVTPGGRAVNLNNDIFERNRHRGIAAKAEWDIGGVTLTSLTSFQRHDLNYALDFDGTTANAGWQYNNENGKYTSQELVLTSQGVSDLKWVLGVYYYGAEDSFASDTFVPALIKFSSDQNGDAYAVFGEASYTFLNRITLTLGGRYSYEEKSINTQIKLPTVTLRENLADNWSSFTPKAALTYTMNDAVNVYATVSRGFKAGGFNNAVLQGQAYEPEKVTNYEVGVKSSLLDKRLIANVSIFNMDYKNLQSFIRRLNPQTGVEGNFVLNAGAARIKGVELELQARATKRLFLDANVAYLDAKYVSFPDAIDGTQGSIVVNVSGNRMPSAPEWAANLGTTYTIPVGSWGSAKLRGDWNYKGKTFFSPFQDDLRSQGSFSLFNARLTFEDSAGKFSVAAWVKNITDNLVAVERNASGKNVPIYTTYLPPRTYGVTIGYKF